MKCANCAFESEQNFDFCPMCGAQQTPTDVSINPAADKVLCALKDNMFLILCILMSASTIMSISSGGLPLLNILFSVFLWLVYASARKNVVNVEQLRNVSGTVYAYYVIMYVAAIIVIIAGIILGAAIGVIGTYPEFTEMINEFVATVDESLLDMAQVSAVLIGVVVAVVMILAAVIIILINVFCIKKIHGFAKSVYQGVQFGAIDPKYITPAKNWLMVLGILSAISAVTSITTDMTTAISDGCSAAAMIVASVLINKVFLSAEQIG